VTCSASKCRSSTERRPARLEEIGLPCHGTFLAQIAVGDLDVAVLGQLPAAQLSLDDKLRIRTGLTDDGNTLIDRALAGDPPLLAINPLKTESERSEQKGFANLVRGTFGMFRNTTAHEATHTLAHRQGDAEDLLSLVSLIHRRLDAAHMPARV
jgi:uncharacterized protein (TIGR02391 family)